MCSRCQCLVAHDHNKPVNIFGYDPKAGSKHALIVDSIIAYDEPKTGQVFILFIFQAIEIKGLNHHLLYNMDCINGVVIDEVPTFLAYVLRTRHAINVITPFDAIHPIIITLHITRVTSNFNVRKSTEAEYENLGRYYHNRTHGRASPSDLLSPGLSWQVQSMLNIKGYPML